MNATLKTKHYLLLVVVFFTIFLCDGHAQQENSLKNSYRKEFFVFGPKIAVNFTNINKAINKEFLPGADLGLFFRFSITRFYLQPEVNYIIRNTDAFSFDLNHSPVKNETHHIDVPLLFGYKLVNLKIFNLRLFVGPEFNFQLPGNLKLTKDYFQLGFQAGLGFDIWRFTIDAGYSFLADINKGVKIQNNIFKVGLGFKCY